MENRLVVEKIKNTQEKQLQLLKDNMCDLFGDGTVQIKQMKSEKDWQITWVSKF